MRFSLSFATRTRSSSRLLYWNSSSAASSVETGIQRVVRHLARGLREEGRELIEVRWHSPARRPRFRLPRDGKWSDGFTTALDATVDRQPWLLVPEIPDCVLTDGLDPVEIGKSFNLNVAAIVHDLIPLKLAHDYGAESLEFFRRYYAMFARADLIIATTDYVAADLRGYMRDMGMTVPPIVVIPLPAQLAGSVRRTADRARDLSGALNLLTVSTWEPRKNLPRLLRALERAQRRAVVPIRLTVAGWHGGYPDYIDEVTALAAAMPNVTVLDWVDNETLMRLYEASDATVYPSWEEGFGLPILESLWMATPCLCHNGSSMAEIAPGGGTLMVDMLDDVALAHALCRLANERGLVARLADEAVRRPLRDWTAYARAVAATLQDHRA